MMSISLDKKQVNQIIKEIERHNGTKIKDFSIKEIVVLFHKEAMDRYESINEKLDKRIEWGQKAINKHDKIIQEITNALPSKGFCDKTELILCRFGLKIKKIQLETRLKHYGMTAI